MVRFASILAVCGFAGAALSADSPPAPDKVAPQTLTINKLIAEKWTEAGIKKPADRSTNNEFLRRAFIDLIGRIPTVEEVLDYEADRSENKRIKLIHRLLYSSEYQPRVQGNVVKVDAKKTLTFAYADEYASHWANLWTVWLMSRTAHTDYRQKMNYWLEGQFANNTSYKEMVKQLLTAKGSNKENGAVNFVMFHLGEATPAEKRTTAGPFDAVPITSRVTRLFLGLQTQCAQCHDHPFNKEWSQSDYWGVNAFFRQTSRSGNIVVANDRQMMADPPPLTVTDSTSVNTDAVVFYERRDGKLMAAKPEFLKDIAQAEKGEKSGKVLSPEGGKTRREQLAEYVLKHDNFSKAYINRIWGHLFGRGLNKEPGIDDFGSNNEVIHPQLLDALAKAFAEYNYDPKQLLFWICTSDVYSLSHVASKEYADPKFDPYFARMPLKAMSPEVLFDALMTATKAEMNTDQAARKRLRETWEAKLVRNFGDDEGNEMTFNGTVVQALLMMNGREMNDEISRVEAKNPILKLIAKHGKSGVVNGRAVIEELFLMTLARRPTDREVAALLAIRDSGTRVDLGPAASAASTPPPKTATPPKGGKPPATPPKQPNRPATVPNTGIVPPSGPNNSGFYLDVLWALINTNEFMLNH